MRRIPLEKTARFDVLGPYPTTIKILRFIPGMLIHSDGRFLDNVLVAIVLALAPSMTATPKKPSLTRNITLHYLDSFAIFPSRSNYTILAKFPTTRLVRAVSK